MTLRDRIDGICNFYYFKSWRQLTKAQKHRSIELYEHWTKFADTKSYKEESNDLKKSQTTQA